MKSIRTKVLLFILLWGFIPLNGFARERLGNIFIDEVLLRPTLYTVEEDGGEFDLADSLFSVGWKKDKNLSAYLMLSSTLNRNLPIYFSAEPKDEVGFVEAYAQYEGLYGRVRFGLLPIGFAYDGSRRPGDQIFEDSLLFSERIMGLRDYGLSLYTGNNGYYTEIIAHNGEIETESDGRLFTTGHWGWTNGKSFHTQLSMQAGSVQGSASTTATNAIAGVKNGESANWRHAALFVNWFNNKGWNVVLQASGGEVEQADDKGTYNNYLVEVTRMITRYWGFGLRYDELDPNKDLFGDKIKKTHLAILLRGDNSTSNLYLIGTKVTEQKNEVPNDEFRLIWLVTPFSR